LSDLFGRKKAIQIGSIIWYVAPWIFASSSYSYYRIIGSIIVCASQNIGMLIAGRIINGLSVGICSAQVPVYITEIAPPSKRGRLVGCQQCKGENTHQELSTDVSLGAITWGILIMFYVSYGCSYIHGTAAFRVPWGLQMLPAIFLFLAMMFLPESPRWLGMWSLSFPPSFQFKEES
jgi:MFS family permease